MLTAKNKTLKQQNDLYKKIKQQIICCELNDYVDNIIKKANILINDNNEMKIYKISKYMINAYTYDFSYNTTHKYIREKYQNISNEYILYKMETVYKQKTGICCDFAELFKSIMIRLNIQCKIIIGGSLPEEQSHIWNSVYINKQWKNLDITWDICGKNLYYTLTMPLEIFNSNHYIYKKK